MENKVSKGKGGIFKEDIVLCFFLWDKGGIICCVFWKGESGEGINV